MRSHASRQAFLTAVVTAILASAAVSAPVLRPSQPSRLDRYLLDDADGVLVVNVKQILGSDFYKKNFQKELTALVALPEAQEYLKDAGFDPLKDAEKMIVCTSKSCWRNTEQGTDNGPYFLFVGKFDAEKLKTRAAALAKAHADKVEILDVPAGKVYHLDQKNNNGVYAALLDSQTVVLAGQKAHVLDALAKAAGKKTTQFVHKEVAAQLKKLDSTAAVHGFAVGAFEDGFGMGRAIVVPGGAPAAQPTLADRGFTLATLSMHVKDEIRGKVVLYAKNKEKAASTADEAKKGLDQIRTLMAQVGNAGGAPWPSESFKQMKRFLDAITVASAGQTVTFEAKADGEMLRGAFRGALLGLR